MKTDFALVWYQVWTPVRNQVIRQIGGRIVEQARKQIRVRAWIPVWNQTWTQVGGSGRGREKF